MWAVFSQEIENEVEAYSTFKKTLLRIITLCFAAGLIFSALTFNKVIVIFANVQRYSFLIYSLQVLFSILLGMIVSWFVFDNMFKHMRKIIFEVSSVNPRWEWLESEYNETDMKALYTTVKRLHDDISKQSHMQGVAEIAARLAHDIRSPLAALNIAVDSAESLPKTHYEVIKTAIQRIVEIANDLLDSHRVKKTKNCEMIFGDLTQILMGLRIEKSNQHNLSRLRLAHQFHPMTDSVSIKVGRVELSRVISNLLDNAIESSAFRDLAEVSLSTDYQDGYLEIGIHDNGCGFSRDHLNEVKNGIFVSRKAKGNGLGLKSAIQLVEQKWSGKLRIESKEGVGCTMIIRLKANLHNKNNEV